MSSKMESKITNPKLAASWAVNTVVCVKNPGPMADVAIKKTAPINTLNQLSFLCMISPPTAAPEW